MTDIKPVPLMSAALFHPNGTGAPAKMRLEREGPEVIRLTIEYRAPAPIRFEAISGPETIMECARAAADALFSVIDW